MMNMKQKPIKRINPYKIVIQKASHYPVLPSRYYLMRWISTALQGHKKSAEVTLRIVDEKESAKLNERYRHKKGPTNVLSFPFETPPGIKPLPLLGDLVLCAPIIAQEARMQHKTQLAHWAHIIIHGTLHLIGYDHINDKDAVIMEQLEIKLLNQLGYANPYE